MREEGEEGLREEGRTTGLELSLRAGGKGLGNGRVRDLALLGLRGGDVEDLGEEDRGRVDTSVRGE